MKDSPNAKFDKRKVEALPDVSAQLERMEAAMESVQRSLTRWAPHIIFCAAITALSAASGAIALVTIAFLVYFGG